MSNPRGDAFILGCQRSGTTLLRLILGAHPEVRSYDEALAYGHLRGRKPVEDTNALRVFKVPRLTEQLLEGTIVDDTYGELPAFYSGQPSVLVVRDPRDVAVSMLTLRDGKGESWIAQWGEKILTHRISHHESFAAAHADTFAALRDAGFPPHRTAALYWRLKNDPALRYADSGLPVLPVRYETLSTNPEPIVRRMVQHLDLPWSDTLLGHERETHDQLESDGLAIGGTDPRRPIDASSVGRYADFFSAEQLREIDELTRDVWQQLCDRTEHCND